MPATPPNPAASAASARSTSWSMLRRIWGRNTQNSRGAAMGPRDYGQSASADCRDIWTVVRAGPALRQRCGDMPIEASAMTPPGYIARDTSQARRHARMQLAMYEGTWESVGTHRVPDWYDDAKLGVFLHWGLYSVPGWAPRVPDIQELLVKDGPKRMLRENPYAEWYLNSHADQGQPDAAAPRRGVRRRLPLRQVRQDVRRRHGRGQPRRHRRAVSGVPAPATSC